MERNKKQLGDNLNGINSLTATTQNLDEAIGALRARIADLDHLIKELGSLGTAIDNLQKEVSARITKQNMSTFLTICPPADKLLVDRVPKQPGDTQLILTDIPCHRICANGLCHSK